MRKTRGFYVALEGVDGCGKTTQAHLLAGALRGLGHAVVKCAEPGGTNLGDSIRDILLGRRPGQARSPLEICPMAEAMLFMAARAQLLHEVVRPAISQGCIVVSDRSLLSTIAYQGYAGGVGPEKVREMAMRASGGTTPDLTIVLTVSDAVARRRRKSVADRIESRGDSYFRAVAEGYAEQASAFPGIVVVDGAGLPGDVMSTILHLVSARLQGD